MDNLTVRVTLQLYYW